MSCSRILRIGFSRIWPRSNSAHITIVQTLGLQVDKVLKLSRKDQVFGIRQQNLVVEKLLRRLRRISSPAVYHTNWSASSNAAWYACTRNPTKSLRRATSKTLTTLHVVLQLQYHLVRSRLGCRHLVGLGTVGPRWMNRKSSNWYLFGALSEVSLTRSYTSSCRSFENTARTWRKSSSSAQNLVFVRLDGSVEFGNLKYGLLALPNISRPESARQFRIDRVIYSDISSDRLVDFDHYLGTQRL